MTYGIYGASGTGQECVRQLIENDRDTYSEKLVFIDDICTSDKIGGYCVFSYDEMKKKYSTDEIRLMIAIGEPNSRKMLYEKIRNDGYGLFSFVNRHAFVDPTVKIGQGCFIDSDTFIDHHTVIGDNSVIYRGSVVGHGVRVGAHSMILVKCFIGGETILEECGYVGSGALISDRIRVGAESIIALGAVVFKDMPEKSTALGNPARIIKKSGTKVFHERNR
ncbi:MAG: hypothetical protein LUC94_01720 [Clostridiales bacterium]|nr:hypothetical protein [Clostridiales bacterium]